ncbi:hypothetical protein NEF87_004274 [Candidatus Lokiarchaeum ossiferum]|uniref:Glycosyl transferase family 1 domain-containing protein n=1 Tax=Candidatus Lokiarchaeum ossiferum TaxID=2951803 RepID=A0ABY6HZJ4_9ARCH|nr:hypothetical protein NEF87_004274 [Candidatus Lokiarchaeum sp. B-35]
MLIKSMKNFLYTYFYYKPYSYLKYYYYKLKKNRRNDKKLLGVNIVGLPKGDFGMGEHIRLVSHSFEKTNLNFIVNDTKLEYNNPNNNNNIDYLISHENLYDINLICLNAPRLITYITITVNDFVKTQYNIGYGYWELPILPKKYLKQFKYLDEVWAPSKFIYDTMKQSTDLPVYHMPIPVEFDIPHHISRKDFNLPENKFLFLFSFDMGSSVIRKNPEAVIQSFKKAFNNKNINDVGLIIKFQRMKGIKRFDESYHSLMLHTNAPNIYIVDELLDREKMLGLINCCDVYISLHRSEGFGLGLAEAMYMGKNVIGTNYSGNVDFMNADNSCLVPYKLIPVEKNQYPYVEKGSVWAEPELDAAAKFMLKLYNDKDFREKQAKNAFDHMRKFYSFNAIGKKYEERIVKIKNNG